MCPIVPTFRCGLVRSNFSLLMLLLRFLVYPLCILRALAISVDELAGDRLRDFLVAIELHGERGPALRRRTQVGCVAEHGRERDAGANRLCVPPRLEVLDVPAA